MEKNILSFGEFLEYTGLSESLVYKLTAARKIPHYKPTGRKIFFKRDEVDAWLLRNRIKTSEELDIEASTYATTH
jgi:excisionase family DNA binding protein